MTDHNARQAGLLEAFDTAYAKAAESSQPDDWMQAALLARQWRNAVLTAPAAPAPNDSPCKIPAKAILARVNAGEALLSRVTVEELKFLAGEGCDCSGSDKDATPVPAAQAECMRSHPHENMSMECEATTVKARADNAAAQQSAAPAECTCPSGNGSLRHPCPVHPADAPSEADSLIVPRKPTPEMLYAMAECDGYLRGDRDHPSLVRWEDYWRMAIGAVVKSADALAQRERQQGADRNG